MSSYLGDDSNDTVPTSDITDAYDDADESQSFTADSDHHHNNHHQLAASSTFNTTHYRSGDGHSTAHHDDTMDQRKRVTRQRDQAALHQHALDTGVNVTAVHGHHQHVDKPPVSNLNRQSASGIYSITDEELITLFEFGECVGRGNWGRVFVCRPLDPDCGIGHASAISSGGSGGRVAIKIVERHSNPVSD